MGIGWKHRKKEIYVYKKLIHILLQQKPIQHCKAIILQLKIKFFIKLHKMFIV